MIIFDIIIAALLTKYIPALNMAGKPMDFLHLVCIITFLRMAMKISNFIDVIYEASREAYISSAEKEESK